MAHHSADEIATFTSGEQRMVYAAYRDTGELFYLNDGVAELQRGFTKQRLRCVVPNCPSPNLTTVARRDGRRDGFRHLTSLVSEGHAEGVFHRQGKAAIRDWLQSKYPDAAVAVEVPINGSRDRVADVMLTNPSGWRVAFEIQYAALSATEWEHRHSDYQAAGIIDVRLFGHWGSHLKLDRNNQAKLNGVQRTAAHMGMPVLWFNPVEGTVAAATTREYFPPNSFVEVLAPGSLENGSWPHQVDLHLFPLSDATVSSVGFTAPLIETLKKNRADAQARQLREAAAREAVEARLALRSANVSSFMKRVREKATDRQREWAVSDDRSRVFGIFDGRWPAFIGTETYSYAGHPRKVIEIPFPDEQW
jgi:hypothetical protein